MTPDPDTLLPLKHGAPELLHVALAVFRSHFADEEDEAVVSAKWSEWEEERAKAIRTAHFVIRALGGWGSVTNALGNTRTRPAPATDDARVRTFADALLLYGLHLGSCEVENTKAADLEAANCTCGLAIVRRAALASEPSQ